ncbi:MAG: M6 family metalloprotease domain-containing protein [bacterium]
MKRIIVFSILIFAIVFIHAMPAFDGIPPKNIEYIKSQGIDQPNARRMGKEAKGTWNALIILIDFPDYRWNNTLDPNFPNDSLYYDTTHYNNMFSSLNSYSHPGCGSAYTGSVRDFYIENSYGQFDIVSTTTIWYTAPDTFNYYCNGDGTSGTSDDYGFGSYPNNVQSLVEDALAASDANVDFSLYDNDGDGYVDALFVVHAGPGAEAMPAAARPDYIWSHAWSISSQLRDGVYISSYSMEPQDGKIGVFCHEFGHVLGLPDLYDTDYSSEGIGDWGVMSGGSWGYKSTQDMGGTHPVHFCGPFKYALGWVSPITPDENLLNMTIPPVETNQAIYLLQDNNMNSSEYFIIENRQNIGFDQSLTTRQVTNGLASAHGLVIYHVDQNQSSNSNESHRLVDVEEASSFYYNSSWIENLDYPASSPAYLYLYNGNRGDNGDPWPGYDSLTSDSMNFLNRTRIDFFYGSIPNTDDYSATRTLVGVQNIAETDSIITADIYVGISSRLVFPTPADTVLVDSTITIEWESSCAGMFPWDSVYYSYAGDPVWHFLENNIDTLREYDWTVVPGVSDSCRIRIVAGNQFGDTNHYVSDYFIIEDPTSSIRDSNDRARDTVSKSFFKSIHEANGYIEGLGKTEIYDISGRKLTAIEKPGLYFIRFAGKSGKITVLD